MVKSNSVRKIKVGMTQADFDNVNEQNKSSSYLPDILQPPSSRTRRGTFSSYLKMRYVMVKTNSVRKRQVGTTQVDFDNVKEQEYSSQIT